MSDMTPSTPPADNTPGAAKTYVTSPATPPVTPAAGSEAERFIAQEVADAKRSLFITRLVSGGLALFTLIYLGYITNRFQEAMQPARAAEIAQGLVAEKVDEQANAIADNVKQRVPALIEELPDYAIREMPSYRQRLEDQIVGDLGSYSRENAPKLGEHLDDFLIAHQAEVKQMLTDGKNPALMDKVGADLEKEFLASLAETDAGGGESFREKMNLSLKSLEDIKKKTAHLAANKGLTPNEKKTRRAIAILAGKIDTATASPDAKPVQDAAAAVRKGAASL